MEERKRGDSTCMISVRTLGTSEKKKSTNTPATAPKDAAVTPLDRWNEFASARSCGTCGLSPGGRVYKRVKGDEGRGLYLPCSSAKNARRCGAGRGWRDGDHVQFQCSTGPDAMEIGLDFITATPQVSFVASPFFFL